MPKSSIPDSSCIGANNISDSHNSSKKWFTKISLLPKKLKNGKSSSTLSNALQNAKKNSTLEGPLKLSQCDNNISVQTMYEPSGENNTVHTNESLLTQVSQLTLNSTKNENTLNADSQSNDPAIYISPVDGCTPLNDSNTNVNDNETTYNNNINTPSKNINIRRKNASRLKPAGYGHRRSTSDYVNVPSHRIRSYSDAPVPMQPFTAFDEDYNSDTRSYEIARNLRHHQPLNVEKDSDFYEVRTPVVTTHHTPKDTSSLTTPSNTIIEKMSLRQQYPHNKSTSETTTPVLKPFECHTSSGNGGNNGDHLKLSKIIEAMQSKDCGNMTAKEFALAVGITIYSDDSDVSGDEYDQEDKNSVCTISSTLSQLTANGKIPTPDEIYTALSNKSINRQKRKHSAPILNLEMFNPPTPGETQQKASSCCQTFKNEHSVNGQKPRIAGGLPHKVSNPTLERRLPPCISTTNKSNESNLTYVTSKYSSSSSVLSSQSGNTTSYMDLPENDYDSYCSSSSYLQQSMNGVLNSCSPDIINKNNISTTFYSLPRVTFNSTNVNKNTSITASKSTNSIPNNSAFLSSNYNCYRDLGKATSRCHSRLASSLSNNNSPSSSVKKSSPISQNLSPTLPPPDFSVRSAASSIASSISSTNAEVNANDMNVSDAHNMYINAKTIAIDRTTPSPTPCNIYPTSSSWSNSTNDLDHLRFTSMPSSSSIKPGQTNVLKSKKSLENKVEVYTKGRFTITHETYNHRRTPSAHKFEVEKN